MIDGESFTMTSSDGKFGPGLDRRDLMAGFAASFGLAAAQSVHARTPDDVFMSAYLFGFPIYEMARLAAMHKTNTLYEVDSRANPQSRDESGANPDMIDTYCWFDVSNSQIEVDFSKVDYPLFRSNAYHYLQIASSSASTEAFHSSALVLKEEFGRLNLERQKVIFAGKNAEAPNSLFQPEKFRRMINLPMSDGLLRLRIFVPSDKGPEKSLERARKLRSQIKITTSGTPSSRKIIPTNERDLDNFVAVVNETISRSSYLAGEMANLLPAGIGKGAAALTGAQKTEWLAGIKRAKTQMDILPNKYAARNNKGWIKFPEKTGRRGMYDLDRSIAMYSEPACMREEEMTYYQCVADENNNPLVPGAKYALLLFEGMFIAASEWSITMYQKAPDGRLYLVPNPINRYSIIKQLAGFKHTKFMIYKFDIQPDMPDEGPTNWLPSPKGEFTLVLRLYDVAKKDIMDGRGKVLLKDDRSFSANVLGLKRMG
jgi:hypothetical protein